MPILVMFEVKGLTPAKYDEVNRRLTEIGQRIPDGRKFHVCYGDQQALQVMEIYESGANLEAFGPKLGPILQEMGIEAKPSVFPIYNVIE
jgi:hypothetical protein